jgi:hypothetical protein
MSRRKCFMNVLKHTVKDLQCKNREVCKGRCNGLK